MTLNPKSERESYKKMSASLKAFQRCGGLLNMSREELENMPKEVMLATAVNEIAHVWHKLPKHLQNDVDMMKYSYCKEHEHCGGSDVIDGPPPRRLFCCYCQIRDVKIQNKNLEVFDKSEENSRDCKNFNCKQYCCIQ
jgi:hypothetical protein